MEFAMIASTTLSALSAKAWKRAVPSIAAAAFAGAAFAQAAAPTTFPEASVAPPANELKTRLADKVFKVNLADSSSWRLEFKASGYWFINTSAGFNDSGEWKTEDGKLCTSRKGFWTCNDARVKGEQIFLKRTSGEIIEYLAQR
jgi:hypothetical protein